jgi:hypothetical protein
MNKAVSKAIINNKVSMVILDHGNESRRFGKTNYSS